MLSIVLVDDHKLLQQGLCRSIESSGEAKVVAFGDTAEDGLLKVEQHQPDVGIFDLGLPDHSGLWLIRRVRKIFPELPILVLSMHTEVEVVVSALRSGANGYLRKSADELTLLRALRAVVAGEIFLEPQMKAQLSECDLGASTSERYLDQASDTVLSAKEMEVLRMTSAGSSNQETAKKLGLSNSTVKARLRSIFSKLNVENRTQAVAAAISLKLIED